MLKIDQTERRGILYDVTVLPDSLVQIVSVSLTPSVCGGCGAFMYIVAFRVLSQTKQMNY